MGIRSQLKSTIRCPQCGFPKTESMPVDSCQVVYDCQSCKATLRPKIGDCCVFCSYGNMPCPPIQESRQLG
ncbi:MAG: GDCCVxC domain-containing (seleno)protein [Nitrospirales bacterium]